MKCKHILALGLLALVGTLTPSCNGTDPNALVIHGVCLGYGIDWMEAIVENFTKDTGIPVIFDYYDKASGIHSIENEIETSRTNKGKVDIIFSKCQDFFGCACGANTYNYKYFEDITDVYRDKDETTGLSIEDRTDDAFLNYHKITEEDSNGRYYGMSWANGIFGFVRNKDLWEYFGYKDDDIPYTTDQMFTFADNFATKVKGKDTIYPFIHCATAEYYTTMMPIWFAQYEGSESIERFNNCQTLLDSGEVKDPSSDPESAAFYKKPGILETLKIIKKLLVKENGKFKYQSTYSTGALSFITLQDLFLKGRFSLLMPCGSWLENETSVENYNADFIPTPIVSSIINKTDSINDDETLASVVKSIRKGDDSIMPDGVTEKDKEIIKDAMRNSYLRSGCDHHIAILSSSNKIDKAKQFLKYMYSDKGLNVYHKATNGGMLATAPSTGYDDTGIEISTFKKSVNDALKDIDVTTKKSNVISSLEVLWKHRLYYKGGISRNFNNGLNVNLGEGKPSLCQNANVYAAFTQDEDVSAEAIYERNYDYLKAKWSEIWAKSYPDELEK